MKNIKVGNALFELRYDEDPIGKPLSFRVQANGIRIATSTGNPAQLRDLADALNNLADQYERRTGGR